MHRTTGTASAGGTCSTLPCSVVAMLPAAELECRQLIQYMLPAVSGQNPVFATAMHLVTTPPARPPLPMRSRPLTQRPLTTAARQAAERGSQGSRQTATRRAATLVRRAAPLPACQSPGEKL